MTYGSTRAGSGRSSLAYTDHGSRYEKERDKDGGEKEAVEEGRTLSLSMSTSAPSLGTTKPLARLLCSLPSAFFALLLTSMPSRRSVLLDGCVNIAFIAASYAHIVLSPYTKVEESFSIQASHDILVHGISPTALAEVRRNGILLARTVSHALCLKYDHNAFPGAVPRSFLGPLLLSSLSYPVLVLFGTLGLVKTSADAALYIRLILATLFTTSILFFSYKALSDARLSARQQTWNRRAFIFISMLQFHPLFWAGRTTPNGIVSPVVFVALALVFSSSRLHRTRDYYAGLSMLTASMVVARMELVGIVIPIALVGLFSRSIGGSFASRLLRIAATGLITAISSIGECNMLHKVLLH